MTPEEKGKQKPRTTSKNGNEQVQSPSALDRIWLRDKHALTNKEQEWPVFKA